MVTDSCPFALRGPYAIEEPNLDSRIEAMERNDSRGRSRF
jgi:hypothetical protein